MRARIVSLMLVTSVVFAMAACGGAASPTPEPSSGQPASSEPTSAPATEAPTGQASSSSVKAGMVTTVGGLGDQGFNDLAWAGLQKAKDELGADVQVLEPNTPSEYVDDLSQLADNDYLAFGVGYLFTDAITEVAAQYPDSHFAIIDSVVDAPNVASLTFHEEQGSYLVGVLAAHMTLLDTEYTQSDTKVVGFLGALEIPIIQKFEAGYIAGVKSVDPDIQVIVQFAGSDANAFVNPTAGYELSQSMIDKGADVIYHAAGSTGAGVFKAAKERHIFAVGVDMDQAPLFPDSPILTSMMKRVDVATYKAVEAESTGDFPGGQQVVFGLTDGGIDLAPFYQFDTVVPQDVKDALDKAKQDIISGAIEVPTEP